MILKNGQEQNRGQSCLVVHADGAAANAACTATTATPPPGQFVYVTGIDVQISADATGAAVAALKTTSTNLWGWASVQSLVAGAGAYVTDHFAPAIPIRAQQSDLAVTVVSPAASTHAEYAINIYYYVAP
jgi:hypothetical protein